MAELETRFTGFIESRVTKDADERQHITGYVTVYNSLSDPIFNFREEIMPGAFTDSLDDDTPKRSYFNHNPDMILGNSENGTASFVEDRRGVFLDAIPPETRAAQDVVKLIEGGYVNHASFAFVADEDKWAGTAEKPIRKVVRGRFFEGGPVSDPAYPQTTMDVRTLYRNLGLDIDAIRLNVARYYLGQELGNADAVKRAIDTLNKALGSESGEDEHEARWNQERIGKLLNKLRALQIRARWL
jgi:HK97 family phage prohead protease